MSDKILIAKCNGKYECSNVLIDRKKHGKFFLSINTIYNGSKFELDTPDDIIDLKSMYNKNKTDVYIPISDIKDGDFVMFYDNDAKKIHESSDVGWGSYMVNSFNKIGIAKTHENPNVFKVDFGNTSWSIYKTCLKGLNMNLFNCASKPKKFNTFF